MRRVGGDLFLKVPSTGQRSIKPDPATQPTTSTARRSGKKWDPYSEHGRSSLLSLVADLERLTQEASAQRAAKQEDDTPIPLEPAIRLSQQLPTSPLVEVAVRRKRIPKRLPTKQEKQNYGNNPWARMLASPVRNCQVTGARVPADLLMSWTLVKNPIDEKVYLMPYDLALLEKLRDLPKKRTRKDSAFDERENIEESENEEPEKAQHAGAPEAPTLVKPVPDTKTNTQNTRPQPSNTTSPTHTSQPKLRTLNYISVLTHITRGCIRRNPQTNEVSIGKGTVARIFPYSWKMRFQSAQHYEQIKQRADKAAGIESPFNPESEIKVDEVQWKHDIDLRSCKIMRERIIAAMEGFAKRDANNRARNKKKTLSSGIPRSTLLVLKEGKLVERPNPQTSPELDSSVVSIPLITMDGGQSLAEDTERVAWPAGSALLYVGPQEKLSSMASIRAPALEPHDLVPPMVQISTTCHIPVFSLGALCGSQGETHFQELGRQYPIFEAPKELTSSSGQDQQSGYLILFESSAPGTREVVYELWRLWCFVGGHRRDAIGSSLSLPISA